MAIIKCPECGNDVSDKAEMCPKCGYAVKEELKKIKDKEKKEVENKYKIQMAKAMDKSQLDLIFDSFSKEYNTKFGENVSRQFYSECVEEIESFYKYDDLKFEDIPEFSVYDNALICDIECHQYLYCRLVLNKQGNDSLIRSMYRQYFDAIRPQTTEEKMAAINYVSAVAKAGISNAVSNNYHKSNPYVVGGLVDGALGPGAGLYAATTTALNNQKIDDMRKDASEKINEARIAKQNYENIQQDYSNRIQKRLPIAQRISSYMDEVCYEERRNAIGDYYTKIQIEIEKRRITRIRNEEENRERNIKAKEEAIKKEKIKTRDNWIWLTVFFLGIPGIIGIMVLIALWATH